MANEPKISAKRINVNEVDNTALIEAIKTMRGNFTPETQNKVINLALKSTFFVPAMISTNTELVADKENKVKFEDRQQAKFLLITNPEKGTFFPAFTDTEKLNSFKFEQKFQAFAMTFSDIANLTEKTPNVNGFMLNPGSENLPFTKEILENIKQVIIEARNRARAKAEGSAEEGKPNITLSSNENPEE